LFEHMKLADAPLLWRRVLPLDVARHLGWSAEVFERVSGIATGAAGGEVVSLSTRRPIHFEGEQTAFDFADNLAIDLDGCAGDSLHDGFHRAGEYAKRSGLSSLERTRPCVRLTL